MRITNSAFAFPIVSVLVVLAVYGVGLCRAQQQQAQQQQAQQQQAQQIVLKSGQVVEAQNLRREGSQLIATITVNGQPGAIGYEVANVDHLEIPRPPAMIQAEQLLASGRYPQALALIDPVTTAQYQFRDLNGGFWATAMLVKANILLGLNRTQDATVILTQISLYDREPAAAFTAKARLAGIVAQGGKEKAREAIRLADEIIAKSTDRGALGEAYLAKGRAYYAQDNYPDALLAFLHLPVLYDQQPVNTAAALMGSARCYMAMGDTRGGVRSYLDVEEQFPTLPEAAAAKAEIEKGGAKLATIAAGLKNEKEESEKQFNGLAPTEGDNSAAPQ